MTKARRAERKKAKAGRVKRLERERVAVMLPTVWYACLHHLAQAGGKTAVALACEQIAAAWAAAGLDPATLPMIPRRGRPAAPAR